MIGRKAYLGALGAALLLLMVGSMAWPLASSAQPVAAMPGSGDAGARAAKVFVEMANRTITRILGLAKNNGLELPENLTLRAREALRILDKAYGLADERPGEAFSLAVKALEVFRPVAQYVFAQLGIDTSVDREALEKAIEMHIRFIEEAKERIREAAEKHNATVPQDVMSTLEKAEKMLVETRDSLEAGNITVSQAAKRLGEAKLLLAKAMHESGQHVAMVAFKLKNMGVVVKHIGAVVLATERAVNITITAIENNRTRAAVAVLDKAICAVDRAINASAKVEAFMENHNIGNDTVEMLSTIREALVQVKQHLVAARDSLEKGDTAKALEELEAARQKLADLIEYLKEGLKEFRGDLLGMLHRCRAMHGRLEKAAKKHFIRGSKLIIRGTLS